jgi:hypothetical protein
MSAGTWTDDDEQLGLGQPLPSRPVPRPRVDVDPTGYLPPVQPAVVDDPPAPLENRRAAPAAPRPRVQRQPRPPLRADVLALVLAAVVCVCVTVLALQGVAIPEVLQTIGFVAVGGAFGMAIPSAGRKP